MRINNPIILKIFNKNAFRTNKQTKKHNLFLLNKEVFISITIKQTLEELSQFKNKYICSFKYFFKETENCKVITTSLHVHLYFLNIID